VIIMADNGNGCCSAIEQRDNVTAIQNTQSHGKTSDVTYRPPLDLYDLGDRYEIQFDVPGTTAEAIEVTVHDQVLTVEARVQARYPGNITPLLGEYGVGDFRRQVRLGEDIDSQSLSAIYTDGVLTLSLPKRAERQPRRIEVRAG